jgi:hypothetical protein
MKKAIKKATGATTAPTEEKPKTKKKQVRRKRKIRRKAKTEKPVVRKKRVVEKTVKKRRGRPAKKKPGPKPAPKKTTLIELPINGQTDVDFWSNMVAFLNENKKRSFIIQLDGKSFSLGAT